MTRNELAVELYTAHFGEAPSPIAGRHWLQVADRAIELLGQPVKPERRKIVQVFGYGGGPAALCDDGTIWEWHIDAGWQPLFSEIPQPGQEPA